MKPPNLHPGQETVRRHPARFKVLACGRRWGKTRLGAILCLDTAINLRGAAWWIAPTYKVAAVGWRQLKGLARQIPGTVIREVDRKAEFPGGGWYQVRSADDPDGLRGEGLNRVILDECAFIAEKAWSEALRPALSDRKGDALFISTPKGQNWFWRAWLKGQEDGREWMSWRFPSVSNPHLDPAEVESARGDLPERTFSRNTSPSSWRRPAASSARCAEAVDKGREHARPVEARTSYAMGVDLARVEDFTVIAVLDDGPPGLPRAVQPDQLGAHPRRRSAGSARYYKAPCTSTRPGSATRSRAAPQGRASGSAYAFTNASKEALIDNLAMKIEQGEVRLMDVPVADERAARLPVRADPLPQRPHERPRGHARRLRDRPGPGGLGPDAAARLAADDCLGARNWAAARLAEMIDLGPPPGFPFRPATAADLACLALGG
jgi:hypothetical protein